ncbi:hypothetical protein HXZ66_03265 [Bacillus sp. A116_S68]|nr:hypothetical protein HXZ66_03265 [Bacillus sp. A116_S68]
MKKTAPKKLWGLSFRFDVKKTEIIAGTSGINAENPAFIAEKSGYTVENLS